MLNLTQTLAVEWAPHDIRVNAIAPGLVATEKTTEQLFGGGEYIDEMTQEIPAGRFAEVEEIAGVASFLVSDYADYVTGATLTIDVGGSLNKASNALPRTCPPARPDPAPCQDSLPRLPPGRYGREAIPSG